MEDNYFDEKFKNILENPPEFEPGAEAIADMHRRLDGRQDPRRRWLIPLWWLIPLLLLPFLIGNIFFFIKYKNLNQKLNDITLHQQDTTNRNFVTYHYDTIYTVIYQDSIVKRYYEQKITLPQTFDFSYFPNYSSPFGLYGKPGSGFNTYNPQPFAFHFSEVRNRLWREQNLLDPEEEGGIPAGWSKEPLADIDGRPFRGLKLPKRFLDYKSLLEKSDWEYPEPKVNPIYYFSPQGASVGLSGMPVVVGQGTTASYNGTNLGITAALSFREGIELQVGAERLAIGFELKETSTFEDYPILPPDDPMDILKEIYVDFTYFQVPIVFKKHFRLEKNFRPFFGVGMVAQRPLKQQFRYEYIGGALGEYKKNQSFSEGDFSINNIRGSLGAHYQLGKRISAQAEGVYQYGFDQGIGEYFPLRFGALNLGLKYHFY